MQQLDKFISEVTTKIPKPGIDRIWERIRTSCRFGSGGRSKQSERNNERIRNGFKKYTPDEYQKLFGHVCTIDKEYIQQLYIIQDGKCAMTNIPLDWKYNMVKEHPLSISSDRIDSSKGYVPGNIQLVLLMFNLAKNKTEPTEWRIVEDIVLAKLK